MTRATLLFRHSRAWRVLLPLALLALLTLGLPKSERSARAADRLVLSVIVAKDSPLGDLSMTELKRLFSGEGDSLGDTHAIPFNQPPRSTDRVLFDKLVLGMDPDQVSQYWIDRRIRGLSGPPRTVDSLSLLFRLVARLNGGVAYAHSTQLPAEVRALRVAGKLPTDPGYPLAQ
jgi:hypothetical protein